MTSRESTALAERARRWRPWLAALAVLAGTALVVLVVLARERRSSERAFEERARTIARAVDDHFAVPLGALRAVSAFAVVDPAVEADRFHRFAHGFLAAHPSLAALEWAERVEGGRRSTFEAEQSARTGGPFQVREPGPDGLMVPSPARDLHVVLTLLEPPVPGLEGLDLRFEPTRRAAVDAALARRAMLATSRFRLVEDPPDVYSIAVYDPVGDGAQPRGVGIALYRLEPLARGALAEVDLNRTDVVLLDEDPTLPEADRFLFESRPGARRPDGDRFVRREPLRFVDRSWVLLVSEPARRDVGPAWLAGAVGAIIAAGTASWLTARDARARLERDLRKERELGEYTLVGKLGEGGMGEVFEARHRLLRRRVAVKLIRPEKMGPEAVERFTREARTTAELSHPHTITLFDYGVAEDGRLFLVMEYLDGLTLEALVERFGPQPPERVRSVLVQACQALAEAHDRDVIHRDLKPANLMLCRLGGEHDFVKVLDFGLAKIRDRTVEKLSAPGAILGTLACSAPECLSDAGAASPRSDIYALGCIAYYLLSGRDVFRGASDAALVSAHLVSRPDELPERAPAALRTIVMRCLEKDPAARFPSVRQLAYQLGQLALPTWSEADAAAWWQEAKVDDEGRPSRALSRERNLRPQRTPRPSDVG